MNQNYVDAEALRELNYYLLECLERFTNVEVACFSEGDFFDVQEHPNFNAVRQDQEFRDSLITQCDKPQSLKILIDEHQVSYIVLRTSANTPAGQAPVYFFVGPMALRPMNKVMLHQYYRKHGSKQSDEKWIPVLSMARLLMMAQLAAGLILGKKYTEEELLQENQHSLKRLQGETKQNLFFSMEQEEREAYHHTYQDEQRLLNCVREGQTQEALRLNLAMDDATGVMSENQISQVQKIAIVAVTLNTRAAIEGGVPPYEAYQISDYYMQKIDLCSTEPELRKCKNEAVRTFADRVHRHKTERKTSGYVESCVVYINRHYREHIYLEELAGEIGISPTYLSRLFSKEMGVQLQEYIVKVRVERAANLLTYSNASISEIGDYVNFPSQSYFGRIFKKYKGVTPRMYREQHKPREFGENQI